MKTKFLQRVLWLMIPLLTIFTTNVWGASVTIGLSDTWANAGTSGSGSQTDCTKSGITVNASKGYKDGSTAIRVYKNSDSEITVSSTVGNITKVEITSTASGTSNYGPSKISLKSGQNGTYSYSGKVGKWTYASGTTGRTSVVFTPSAQFRFTQVVAYYAAATVSKESITGLDYVYGSGPSAAQSFTVGATNVTGTLTVTAPTNFEVSKSSGSGYGSSVTLTPSSGTVSTTTIYVRLAAGKDVGTYGSASTYVTVTGGGILTKNISVQGEVTSAGGCDDPTGTSLGATTHATTGLGQQVLNWTGAAANYEIYYNSTGTAPVDQVSETINGAKTCTLTNLDPGTWYWWVRSKCSESIKSAWVAGGSFTINGIRLTNIEMTPTPHIDFGTVLQNAAVDAKVIKVTGVGLSSASTITHSFDIATPFTATPASLDYDCSKASLTVTPSTATAGTFNRTLTITNGTYRQEVTITMTVQAIYTITYDAGSGTCATSSWTQPSYGASTTLPTATPTVTCDGWSFAGWCTSSAGDDEDNTTSPGTILTGSYTPTGDVTLYAVYTKSGGSATTTKNYAITFDDNGEDSSKDLTTSTFKDEVSGNADSISSVTSVTKCYAGLGGLKMASNKYNASFTIALAHSLPIKKVVLNAKRNSVSGTYANGVTVGSTTFSTSSSYSADNFVDLEFTGTKTTSNSLTVTSTSGTSEGTSDANRVTRLKSITIYYETTAATTYYMTSHVCCTNVVPAPTVSATNIHYNQFTLSWTNVTGADSYNVTCTGGTPGAIQSDGTTRTCTITGLASPNTSYSWTVVATYSGSYCGATPAAGSTTTAQVYAVTYNANDGTVSPLPSTVSYEAGVTVTVAAEPGSTSKSGCTFTGWNTQADGQGTHYAASGSATFTMPSSTVTLYAEWTKKKNYYVDRMHGTNDGHTVTIDDVVYNCYLREGANYTVPTISDNTSGASACHSEHDHLLFWVTASSVNADGTLTNSYTEVTPGDTKTATTDGTVYYAIWGKLAD